MVDIGVGEDVVGDVGADVGAVVRPLDRGRQAADGAHELAVEDAVGVDVALDRVVVAPPRPGRAEGDGRPRGAVVVGALRPARRRVDAPEVVEDLVPVGLEVRVLRTKSGTGPGSRGLWYGMKPSRPQNRDGEDHDQVGEHDVALRIYQITEVSRCTTRLEAKVGPEHRPRIVQILCTGDASDHISPAMSAGKRPDVTMAAGGKGFGAWVGG